MTLSHFSSSHLFFLFFLFRKSRRIKYLHKKVPMVSQDKNALHVYDFKTGAEECFFFWGLMVHSLIFKTKERHHLVNDKNI